MKSCLIIPTILISFASGNVAVASGNSEFAQHEVAADAACESLMRAKVKAPHTSNAVQGLIQPIEFGGKLLWFRVNLDGLNCLTRLAAASAVTQLASGRITNTEHFCFFNKISQDDSSVILSEAIKFAGQRVDYDEFGEELRGLVEGSVYRQSVVRLGQEFIASPIEATMNGLYLRNWGRMTENLELPDDIIAGVRSIQYRTENPESAWPYVFTVDDAVTGAVILHNHGKEVDFNFLSEFMREWYAKLAEFEREAFTFDEETALQKVVDLSTKMQQVEEKISFSSVPVFFEGN